MGHALTTVMADTGTLRLTVLESGLTVLTEAFRLSAALPANQPDVAYRPVGAKMPCDGKVIHRADRDWAFHFSCLSLPHAEHVPVDRRHDLLAGAACNFSENQR